MSEENLRILKMIDESKISVEEAHKLLVTIQAADNRFVEAGSSVIKKHEKTNLLENSIDENGEKINVSIRIII